MPPLTTQWEVKGGGGQPGGISLAVDTRLAVNPNVRKVKGDDRGCKFEIGPLEPGFGTTLGNTLRRVLLSSLWGAAVTSIQIEGVAHEFTSVSHVKEDVTEVILNLKQLCLKSFTEDPVTLMLDVKGPAEVHASDIQCPSAVEGVNPELFVKFGDNIQADQAAARGQQTVGNRLDQIAIEELDLSVRAFNCLKANDITTVGQLLTKKEDELLSLRNFGRKSLDEIKEKLVEKGFVEPDQMDTVFR